MSESGITRITSPASSDVRHAARSERGFRVESLPDSLKNMRESIKLRGEVTRVTQDGQIEVRTERGPLILRPDGQGQKPPQTGDRVDIRLSSGQPPTQAIVIRTSDTAAPEAPAPVVAQHIDLPTPAQPLSTDITINVKPLPEHAPPPAISRPFVETVAAQPLLETASPFIPAAHSLDADLSFVSPPLPAPLSVLDSPAFFLSSFNDDTPPQFVLSPVQQEAFTLSEILTKVTFPPSEIAPPNKTQILPPDFLAQGRAGILPSSLDLRVEAVQTQSVSAPHAQDAFAMPDRKIYEGRITVDRADGLLQGRVHGFTPEQHFPVVQILSPGTLEGRFFVLQQSVSDLPAESVVTFSRVASTTPAGATPGSNSISAQSPLLSGAVPPAIYFTTPDRWPLLEDVQKALVRASLPTAQSFINMAPSASTPAQFGPAALFFLAAVRSGDIQGWIGDKALEALRRGEKSHSLLSRLSQEFSSLGRFMSEQASQEWRVMALPLAWQNEIHKIALFYRREDGEHSSEDHSAGRTRFVINLQLSQIGPVQMDALFQPEVKRMDLILRTTQSFSHRMQSDMRGVYQGALEESGFSGDLRFQNKPEQWVTIQPEIKTFGASA